MAKKILREIRRETWTFEPTDVERDAIRAEYKRLKNRNPDVLRISRSDCLRALIRRGAGISDEQDKTEGPAGK